MTQPPVKLYICYAPEKKDKAALSKLEKHLTTFQRSKQIQLWYRDMVVAGDNHAKKIVAELDQAQAVIMLVSSNLLAEYYDSAEMRYALQLHQEAKVRVIPIILDDCSWKETPLGELTPLPDDGKPISTWNKEDRAWQNVKQGIIGTLEYTRALTKKEPEQQTYAKKTRKKSRKPAQAKREQVSNAALTTTNPTTTRPPGRTRVTEVPQPGSLPPKQERDEEPEPITEEARTATPAYDQRYVKLQDDISLVIFKIGIWEPALHFPGIVAEERRTIYQALKNEKHQCWLGKDLQVPPGVSLQNREVDEARDADLTILLVEPLAISEMHEFCDHEELLGKTRIFYPEELKSAPEDWGLDIRVGSYGLLSYYQEIDIHHCNVRTEVLKWVMKRRSLRYSIQSRSGR